MQTVTITRLGHRGDGIAPGPVFVPRALPGETVRGTPEGSTLTDIRIDRPSDDRVSPPCRHYRTCGGCALQHASDDFVAMFKTNVAREALAAHGIEAPMRPILTSPPATRRRATFAARRTKKSVLVGFHARASDVITDIPDCLLVTPGVLAARAAVADMALAGASRKTPLSVTVTETDTGLDLVARGGKPLDGPLHGRLAEIAERHDLARLSWDDEVIVTRLLPVLAFGSAMVTPPPGAFLQATQKGEADLLAAVREAVAGAKKIVDLFAGCGTFALPLARDASVHAVESERDMLGALDRGWRHAQGLRKVTHEARDLFRNPLLPDELGHFDAAVIDPPRAGAEAQTRALAEAQIPRIAFVSCNPVTFARDAKTLVGAGYRLDWVQVVDQFRWSAHVELAARFSLAHMAADTLRGAPE